MSEGRLVQIGRRPGPAQPAGPTVTASPSAPTVYLETYGCQMNVADSDLISSLLADAGYRKVDDPSAADVMLLNTCAVREKAEDRVLARAVNLAAIKRKRPGAVLGVVGCMAEHLKGTITERAPAVDLIAGPDSYRRIVDLVARARGETGAVVIDTQLDKAETYDGLSGAK